LDEKKIEKSLVSFRLANDFSFSCLFKAAKDLLLFEGKKLLLIYWSRYFFDDYEITYQKFSSIKNIEIL